MVTPAPETLSIIESNYSHYIIIGCSVGGIVWGSINAWWVSKVEMEADKIKLSEEKVESDEFMQKLGFVQPTTQQGCLELMERINKDVKEGAITFLKKEYCALAIFCALFGAIVLCAVDMPWKVAANGDTHYFPYTTFAFLVGAATSMACGYAGMMMATTCNVKTTYLCNINRFEGFKVAFQGGQVLGFVLVGLALLVLEIIILSYTAAIAPTEWTQAAHIFEFVSGYGLGGSTVALFGRVGGGIYTKAADVGADLAGKVCQDLPEDSPLNPGTIADNVGDNVGDIAGMGADLFGSLAESTCAALVVSAGSKTMVTTPEAMYFPLVVTAIGIGASFICQFFAYIYLKTEEKGEMVFNTNLALKIQLWVSTILMSGMIVPATFLLPDSLDIVFAGQAYATTPWEAYACIILGLWSGLFIGLITEYYTGSSEGSPTYELAKSCVHGPAPEIINGLALGYLSTVVPIFCLAVTVLISFKVAAMYGVALAAIGMLGCLPIALSIDGYGPVADNAGGIAEMANLDPAIRDNTDALDAAGNTTAAIGKGFAIGSAALVALALFGAFVTRVSTTIGADTDPAVAAKAALAFNVNILEPFTFAGLLLGAMLPYWFSAMTMKAVGDAAQDMLYNIQGQFAEMQKIASGETSLQTNEDGVQKEYVPDHESCIKISTDASLRKMIAPGLLVILSPLVAGSLFGFQATNGILAGCIVSGIQIAFSASNSGGAWDNAKKIIEAQRLRVKIQGQNDGEEILITKDTPWFKDIKAAAVAGDTVGDPLKDTSGPAINILIKLSAIVSLVFGTFIAQYGGLIAGGKAAM